MNSTTNNEPMMEEPIEDSASMTLKDLFNLCVINWKWFVLSLLVCMSVAFFYLLKTSPVYSRSASILIKEGSKGNDISSDATSSFTNLGLFQSSTNVSNELNAIKSPVVILDVVKRLKLNVNYNIKGRFHNTTLYGSTLPIEVLFPEYPDRESVKLNVKLLGGNRYQLTDFGMNGEKLEGQCIGRLGSCVKTPIGRIKVDPSPFYIDNYDNVISVSRLSVDDAANACKGQLTATLADDQSSIINLNYTDVSTQRAEDFLNMLIVVYNEEWVEDKNKVATSTSQFINERLKLIEKELGNVDSNISSYKSANLLPNVDEASSINMTQASAADANILTLNNQLYMAKYIHGYLQKNGPKKQLIPANSGINNAGIESQISEYNTKLLRRNDLAAISGPTNPLVVDLDASLNAMRHSIIVSVDNQIVTIETQLRSQENMGNKANSQIASNPKQARHLLTYERQQKIKETLYLFLLQKREENELSQAFTAYNTRVTASPNGSNVPITPNAPKILLIAFAIGLLTPIGIIFLMENFNTTVRSRKDIEAIVSAPFVGEIPFYEKTRSKVMSIFKKKVKLRDRIVVKDGSRNVINEAFRILRTNLEFMITEENKSNVFVIISFNPGSGKSFLTLNTAISFAIKKKKVLIIDGDLRHASLSRRYAQSTLGLSDYLGHKVDDFDSIIQHDADFENLDAIEVGTIPPNPTELLFDNRLKELLAAMRERYDYIFIDCPPVDMVADTSIISKLSDKTIFVVRAGLLERNMLKQLENDYKEGKYKNMSVVLNGTCGKGGYYGYHYGYYGYYGSRDYYSNH